MLLATGLDTVWVLMAAFLVFFMQAGFGLVEAGFIRAKNACNILMRDFLDFAIGCICFFLVGYAFMFGRGNGFMGLSGFALNGAENPSGVPLHAFWLFQACFCGAAASMAVVFLAIRATIGLRVPRSEELRGLDIGEHGMESYAGLQVFVTQ